MVNLGNRRDANPIVLNPDGSTGRPGRVPFSKRMFEEGWLQDLIEDNPELLPVTEIEPAFAPLVSVGREVATASGSIDNLFLSPQGYLTIAETKLWRNPEARREVVGQLIDYAKDVSRCTFEELERKVRDYNAQRGKPLFGILDSLRQIEDIEESEEQIVIDAITRNLQAGRFLLLVVGDGIRESVEAMADFLQQTPQLHFTLALVELQVYELGEEGKKPFLVLPQIVARTREITRAVVRIEGQVTGTVQVGVDVEPTADGKLGRSTLTKDDFLMILRERVVLEDVEFTGQLMKDAQTLGCIIDWKQGSFVIKLPDPGGSGQGLSLLVVEKGGQIYIRNEFYAQLGSLGLPKEIASDYAREAAELFGNCRVKEGYFAYWSRTVSLSELRQRYQEFRDILEKTINRIKEASNE